MNLADTKMSLLRSVINSPAKVTIFSFAAAISIGTVLLMLPVSSESAPIRFVDALFTAASAVCVTGLTVFDTAQTFSLFGEVTILCLIQTGGLGIMTLSVWFILMAGKRPGLYGQELIHDAFTHSRDRTPASIVRDVFVYAFLIEGIGMVLLFLCFLPVHGIPAAIYLSLFHAVSAFCNAGFSLFSDSFIGYRENWAVLLVISFLVIAGGLGFLVLSEIRRQVGARQRIWVRLSLHSKIVLSMTAVLLISATLLIAFMEWRNTLGALPVSTRFLSAFFQTVNTRTSGFNSLPIGHMANETLLIMMILMFIGASPGSCGGGIKTTTFAAIVALGMSRFRGQERPQLFGRTISPGSAGKAVSVMLISTLVIGIGLIAILMSEVGELPHPESRGMFLELFFEIVSAFGTVGLSTGLTAGLSDTGKLIITLMMFVGRVGPLVIVVAVSRSVASRYYYAEETIMVG